MKGYWNSPAETSKVLGPTDSLQRETSAMMTRKVYVRIVDRRRTCSSCPGSNVYPNEIESVVAMLPGVLECAVHRCPDAHSAKFPSSFA